MSSVQNSGVVKPNDYLGEALIENVKWLNTIIWTATIAVTSILILKLLGKTEFKWSGLDITISLDQSWIVFVLLTVAHLYVAMLTVRSARDIWKAQTSNQQRVNTYFTVVNSGNILIRGMIPRVHYTEDLFGIRWLMVLKDPTTWASYLLGLLFLLAVVPFQSFQLTRAVLLPVGGVLLWINWRAGANWIIAISQLSLPLNGTSFYFDFLDGQIPLGVARVGSGSVTIPSSALALILAVALEVIFLASFIFGGHLVAAVGRFGLLSVWLGIVWWNFDLGGYAEKIRWRIGAGYSYNEMQIDRGLDRLPFLKLSFTPAAVWIVQFGELIYHWRK